MIEPLTSRAARGPLLLDAAMGTRLIAAGLDLATDDPCLWNLSRPDAVLAVHQCDVAAGAEAVFTNTFGANRANLARLGRAGSVGMVNRRAVAMAREASGPDRYVIGSIGPMALGDEATLLEQVDALADAGVDAIVLETCRLDQALAALSFEFDSRPPVLVGLYTWPEPLVATADRLVQAGAAIVGVNCCADLAFLHRWLDVFEAVADLPFWLKPSTGWPDVNTLTPADFAGLAARLQLGLLGGCCGTSELHLEAIRRVWRT